MTSQTACHTADTTGEPRRVCLAFSILVLGLLALMLGGCGGNGATTSDASSGAGGGTSTAAGGSGGGTSGAPAGNPTALTLLQVTPANPTTFVGSTVQFKVQATYANGTTQDVTSSATWNSSSTGVATVSNAASSNGLVTTLAIGSTNISASLSGVTSANALLTVHAIAESVLYSFGTGGAGDGANPFGALIQASDGNFYGMTTLGGISGNGTVIKVSPSGAVTVIHTFGGGTADGSQPYGSLIQASDGNMYGMTFQGGANGTGTVFKVTLAGVVNVIYSFGANGPNDGARPNGSFIQASDGSLYGTTVYGGANNNGTVFKITTAGVEQVVYSFGALGSNDGANPYGSLVQASDGNFYAMTFSGGVNGNGAVVRVTPAGTEQVIHSFGGPISGDGANPYGSLIQASDGNLYGMTNKGGANHAGAVIQVTLAGVAKVIHSFSGGTTDGAQPYGSLIQASDGNLYGTTYLGGASGNGTAFQVTLAGAEKLIYSFGANGPADGANPYGDLVQASDWNLYGMTVHGGGVTSNGTVFKLY